ncbi:CHAT domain-containing protein [Streptomyces sp. 130]|uniref:CHAT domain-containing protein n=1 Tax=Streptomyces sp. 130 TaxID=2591006 RepID=UPI00117D2FA1|nr:CHAT domain-containing protein [Streptomyces sp. 130]TRV81502.1 CHAT domain-containing protein [Streptomyces sp. 130]
MESLEVVMSCVREAAATESLDPVFGPGVLEHAQRLAANLDTHPEPGVARYLLGWFHWYRAQGLPEGEDEQDLERARDFLLHHFITDGSGAIPEPLAATIALMAIPSALAHHSRTVLAPDGLSVDVAVRLWTRVIEALEPDDSLRAHCLTCLSTMLQIRSWLGGGVEDVDEAVRLGREAVALSRGTDAASALSALATALRDRYGFAQAIGDLDEAIETGRRAVRAARPDEEDMPGYLSNLCTMLLLRHGRTSDSADLDDAIRLGRRAVALTQPENPDRAARLSNLSLALQNRFAGTADSAGLDEAVEAGRLAVATTPESHREWTTRLSVLGMALRNRCTANGAPADGDEAVRVAVRALRATAESDAAWAGRQQAVGLALVARFKLSRHLDDAFQAAEAFAAAVAAPAAPPHERIKFATSAARLLALIDPSRAADLLEQAVRLLPEVAPRRLGRTDQQSALVAVTGLAGDAAALALDAASARPDRAAQRALSLLESGRTILIGQLLDGRGSLDGLPPALAARFTSLREALEGSRGADPLSALLPGGAATNDDRVDLARAMAATLAEIRAQDGFASFGLPPRLDELLPEAAHGPVVTVNVAERRSDALLLTTAGVVALPLPGLNRATLTARVEAFHAALEASTDPGQDRFAAQASLTGTLEWLWETVAEPVLDELGYREAPPDGSAPPRMWWAPGGLLSLLPLHAAGRYDERGVRHGQAVMERVVSSYTPTIRALSHARRRQTAPPGRQSSLIVAMPTTPGLPGLAHVPTEVDMLTSTLPDPLVLTGSAHTLPTRDRVLKELARHTIAHFACHGAHDPADPSRSRLLLHDHEQSPFTVAALAPIDLWQARLAYLSACETALNTATGLLDEAIHMASAFQAAGYSHVVGTLWSIDDEAAAEMAQDFYAGMRADASEGIDFTAAARALHDAVRTQRDRYPRMPSLWAAHIHVGP